MQKNSEDLSMQDALRMANSPTGRQLLELLQRKNSGQIDTAMQHMAAGNYEQAKESMSALLSSPEVKKLLEQLGGSQ